MAGCFYLPQCRFYQRLRRKDPARQRVRLERREPDSRGRRFSYQVSHHMPSAALCRNQTLRPVRAPSPSWPCYGIAIGFGRRASAAAATPGQQFSTAAPVGGAYQHWRLRPLTEYQASSGQRLPANLDAFRRRRDHAGQPAGFRHGRRRGHDSWTTFLFHKRSGAVHGLFPAHPQGHLPDIPSAPQSSAVQRFINAIHRALRRYTGHHAGSPGRRAFSAASALPWPSFNQPAFIGHAGYPGGPHPRGGHSLVWLPLCLFPLVHRQNHGRRGPWLSEACWPWRAWTTSFGPCFCARSIKAPFFVLILAILCGLAEVSGPVGLVPGPSCWLLPPYRRWKNQLFYQDQRVIPAAGLQPAANRSGSGEGRATPFPAASRRALFLPAALSGPLLSLHPGPEPPISARALGHPGQSEHGPRAVLSKSADTSFHFRLA